MSEAVEFPEATEVADEVVGPPAATAPAVLNPLLTIQAGLESLQQEAKRVNELDLATAAGDKAQRALRQRCVSLRSQIDAAYETINRPLLETQRAARKLVAEITAAIQQVEGPADLAIKERERRKEEERKARERADAERIAAIRRRIDEIRAAANGHAAAAAATLAEAITAVQALDVGPAIYQELADEAAAAKATTLQALQCLHAGALAREQEDQRLEAERKALVRRTLFENRLARIRNLPAAVAGRTAPGILTAIEALQGLSFDDWAEYAEAAETERAAALDLLRTAHAAAEKQASEAAELARLRALDVLRRLEAGCADKDSAGVSQVVGGLEIDAANPPAGEPEEVARERFATIMRLRALRDAKAAAEALQLAQETKPPADADGTPAAVAAVAEAAPLAAGEPEHPAQEREAGPITPHTEESGSSPADAPAPGTPGSYASSGAQAAQALPSGDEGTGAHADECAPSPAQEEPSLALGTINDRLRIFVLTAAGLAALGFEPTKRGAAKLYLASDWPRMKAALVRHIGGLE